jgi:hypothetical protein
MFPVEQLVKKYQIKAHNAKEKGIEFALTEAQYVLMYQKCSGLCDYTGMKMGNVSTNGNYVSLERVVNTEGYTPSNICLIRQDVNALKGYTFDAVAKGVEVNLPSKMSGSILVKMCDTLYNPIKMQAIKDKYTKLFATLNPVCNNAPIELVQQPEVTETMQPTITNLELLYTKMYYTFGTQIEQLGVEYELTYAEYKRMITRKYCQLTDRLITPDSATVWVVNKSLGVTKDNVLVLDSKVGEGLDVFMVNGGLSLLELKKLCKNLIVKGE